jgi:quercetin dioxygenase-like cupin family protein
VSLVLGGEIFKIWRKTMDYPDMISNLPEADIPFKGVQGKLLQGENQQIVFFDIEPIGEVAEHSHDAQFGMVLDGEMTLTIGGSSKRYSKGDSYYIPKGVKHSAIFHTQCKVIDIFNEKERYKSK